MALTIDTKAIRLLRDRLMETGGAPSRMAGGPAPEIGEVLGEDAQALSLLESTIEAMVVMLAADGNTSAEERDLLRGALRELTAGGVRSAEVDRLTDVALARIKAEGASARLGAAAERLKAERVAAEAAFVLAAAMAFADQEIADAENDTLNEFADLLDIDEERANELLDELDA